MGYKRHEALDALEKYDYDLDKVGLDFHIHLETTLTRTVGCKLPG